MLYFKWKVYDNSFNNQIDKKTFNEISLYKK